VLDSLQHGQRTVQTRTNGVRILHLNTKYRRASGPASRPTPPDGYTDIESQHYAKKNATNADATSPSQFKLAETTSNFMAVNLSGRRARWAQATTA
jgi:hypothetical protein